MATVTDEMAPTDPLDAAAAALAELGELDLDGLAPETLTQADIERIVFDSPSRVIDVGAQRRFFRGALRRTIEIRDRTCFHPTCDEVPQRPEIDHIHLTHVSQ